MNEKFDVNGKTIPCYKLESTMLNRKGWYERTKIKGNDLWISLIDIENIKATMMVQDAIDQAVNIWEKEGRKTPFIQIPKSILDKLRKVH